MTAPTLPSTSVRATTPADSPIERRTAATSRRLERPAVAAVLGVLAVLLLGALMQHSTLDLPLTQWMNAQRVGLVDTVATLVYAALEPPFAVLLVVALSALIWARTRNLLSGLRFGAAIADTWLPVIALKLVFHRPRPEAALLAHPSPTLPTDWSFPSGHTAFVTALVVVAVLELGPARRTLTVPLAVLAILGMGAVVLILGHHYPSDVAASILWSTALAPLAWEATGLLAERLRTR